MGKRKEMDELSSNPGTLVEDIPKKHKKHKHKKHKKKRTDSDASGDSNKVKVAAMNMNENVLESPAKTTEQRSAETPKSSAKKKKSKGGKESGTSSDEERWLDAIQSGKLEEVDDELKKIKPKDPKLMTARQRAMLERKGDAVPDPAAEQLLSLPTGYREKVMTPEMIKKAALKSQKRKQLMDEKREKDKKRTMERLLRKQDNKQSKQAVRKPVKRSGLSICYRNNQDGITITLPPGMEFPLRQRTEFDGRASANTLSNLFGLWFLAREYEKIHELSEVVALAKERYDLVLIEMFNTDLFFGIAYKTGAPMIGLSSCSLMPWTMDSLGVPTSPYYLPVTLGGKPFRMNFFQRVMNTLEMWLARAYYRLIIGREAQRIAEKNLGPLPPLSDIAANTSLLLLNSHFSFLGHWPTTPSVVEVGGLNLKPVKPIPVDLEKSLNNSNGVIYFSMGSVLVGKSMSEQKKSVFINVFASSGKTVLWKLEGSITPHPKNIITKPWLSQRDILQHPKVELFISHCGNLGLTEAVDAGVPVICLPMYGDQLSNAKSAEDTGFSIYLSYGTLTEDQLRSAISEILTNKRYKETAKKVQAAFRDRPQSPLETAIYWVEYVLKHGPMTRAPYAGIPILFREGYDVAAFFTLVLVYLVYITIKLYKTCCSNSKIKKKEKQS